MNIRKNNHGAIIVCGVDAATAASSQMQLEYQGKNQTE
jgi:hypothetical protein